MSDVKIQANNKAIKFEQTVIMEMVRKTVYTSLLSSDGQTPFHTFLDEGKNGGDEVNVPLILADNNDGVGAGTLTGNEAGIENYGCRLRIDWLRHAVKASKNELKKASFDIWAKATPILSNWAKKRQKDEITLGLLAIPSETPSAGLGSDAGQRVNGIPWSAATAAQKNTWMDANKDRVLFGSAVGNYSAGSFATSVANVTYATGKASSTTLKVMRSLAEKAYPVIEPIMVDQGYEQFIVLAGTNAYGDLWADPVIYAANKDARPREGTSYKDNPIFVEGDLMWDNFVVKKVPDIDRLLTLAGVGGGSPAANVTPLFLLGKNALAIVWGQMPEATKLDDTDYGFRKGVGTEMCYGVGKVFYKLPDTGALKDWGVVTGFVASQDPA